MKEMIKALLDAGKKDAFDSIASFTAAAKELGYADEEISKAVEDFDGFPLDDDDLDEVVGGMSSYTPHLQNRSWA